MAQRNDKGQFVEGGVGNPKGRPKKAREDRYYQIAMSAVPFPQWKRIFNKAAQQAEKGDAQARKFLADYLLGPPQQHIDVTSGGKTLPTTTVYLPKIDGLETESGTTGEVSPQPSI